MKSKESKEYSAYIMGLIEGSAIDTNTPEGKVAAALADLAGQMAYEIEALSAKVEELGAYIEELDEDLGAVEELVYGDGEFDDEECDGNCDGCCGCDDLDDLDEDEDVDDDEDDEEFYCAMCPHCGGKIYFNDSVNPEDILCPSCQKPLIEDEEDLDELDGDEEDDE